MEIDLYITGSERHAVRKNLQSNIHLTGSLRGESSIINPSFLVELDNPSAYNYCFVPAFNRYYFINNITSVRTHIWRLDCSVDVLMSYQTQILNLLVVASAETSPDAETYYNGKAWETTVKTKTDVITFPNGLLDDGEYILITSGGIVS